MKRLIFSFLIFCYATMGLASEFSGYVAMEWRGFNQAPLDDRQFEHNQFSLSVQPEFYTSWDNDRQSFTFVPYARIDQQDSERTHFDIRELTWMKVAEKWELRLGIRKLFWGVTESQHLVDIINQTDAVENTDGEDKLGQPMVNLALIDSDWGTLDLFILTGFRERTFAGVDGRLRTPLPVDTDAAQYESSREEKHIDWAARWQQTLGDWEVGLSYFQGTGRDPLLLPKTNAAGKPVLIPYYEQIRQTGLDVQWIYEDWLWKLEAIHRDSDRQNFLAATGGFEYTFVGIMDSSWDLGLIGEYLYDDRDDEALTAFQNDLFAGLRLTLNDAQSSELLMGVIQDLDHNGRLFSLEASRRLGESWKLTVEARLFSDIAQSDPFYSVRDDDHIQVELAWYF